MFKPEIASIANKTVIITLCLGILSFPAAAKFKTAVLPLTVFAQSTTSESDETPSESRELPSPDNLESSPVTPEPSPSPDNLESSPVTPEPSPSPDNLESSPVTPEPSPSPDNLESTSAKHSLVGRWQSQDSAMGLPELTFIFGPTVDAEGKLITVYDYSPVPFATLGKYQVSQPNDSGCEIPHHTITLIISQDEIYQTIYQLSGSNNNQLRMQLVDIMSGEPPPCNFTGGNVRRFKKISDNTDVPEGIEVVDLENPTPSTEPEIPSSSPESSTPKPQP